MSDLHLITLFSIFFLFTSISHLSCVRQGAVTICKRNSNNNVTASSLFLLLFLSVVCVSVRACVCVFSAFCFAQLFVFLVFKDSVLN